MMTLAELKNRQATRKVAGAPMVKLFGPDQTTEDFDYAIQLIDGHKELFREVLCWLRNNPKQNDEMFDELLTKVGAASE